MSYFRNGHRNDHGGWVYSHRLAFEEFVQMYPEHDCAYRVFSQHVTRIVDRFISTGTVVSARGVKRRTTLTEEKVVEIQRRMLRSPQKSVRKLAAQAGTS